jgi:DNA-binding NarL/FixJ family response regulator
MRLLRRLIEERRPENQPSPRAAAKPAGSLPGSLSARELDVLCQLCAGKTNRQIAQELHLSLSTVKTYLGRVLTKLEVSDRTQAAVKAVQLGLLPERGKG